MANLWNDFLSSGSITLKVTLILIGIAVFIAIASTCSPVFQVWGKVTGYGI
jgi:hypothetical protein